MKGGILFAVSAVLLFVTVPAEAATVVYAALGSANKVAVIDGATHQRQGYLLGAHNPVGLVTTREGLLLSGSGPEEEGAETPRLYLIDPAHGHAVFSVQLSAPVFRQALTADGRFVVSTHPQGNRIGVFELASLRLHAYMNTGKEPFDVAVSRSGDTLYISNRGAGTITQIGTAQWRVTRTLDAGSSPEYLALSSDDKTLFVSNGGSAGTISSIDLDTGRTTGRYKVGATVEALVLGEDGRTLFAVGPQQGSLYRIKVEDGSVDRLELGPKPSQISSISGTGMLYVASHEKPVLWVVNQQTFELVNTIDVAVGQAWQMAVTTGVELAAPSPSPQQP